MKGLVIGACASNCGKTVTSLGLICALKQLGYSVLAAKCGPDYIDSAWLNWASGLPVANFDLRLSSQEGLSRLLQRQKHHKADALLVAEGVMGIYDGDKDGRYSTAEIAAVLNLPILLLINVKGMGHSMGALAEGYLNYSLNWMFKVGKPRFFGIICTHCGGESHERLCREILDPLATKHQTSFLGCLPARDAPVIPSRHLGLTSAEECKLKKKELGQWFRKHCDIEKIIQQLAPETCIREKASSRAEQASYFFQPHKKPRAEIVIAIAKDSAFSFCYADLPAMLEEMGAHIIYFSPLNDERAPDCDGIYIPGGYPELYAEKLSGNLSMKTSLCQKAKAGIPIYGECGGYIYLGQSLSDKDGIIWDMCKLLPVAFAMTKSLQALGYRFLQSASQTQIYESTISGHEFHYAKLTCRSDALDPLWKYTDKNGNLCHEGVVCGNISGSWMHLYPEGSRDFWQKWLKSCQIHKEKVDRIKRIYL